VWNGVFGDEKMVCKARTTPGRRQTVKQGEDVRKDFTFDIKRTVTSDPSTKKKGSQFTVVHLRLINQSKENAVSQIFR
jgi:hypothetical protein